MQLSKKTLSQLTALPNVECPSVDILELPEKVIQFGTGVLLRALPDYFIDKANKQGLFNGRIVMVKSTDSDSTAFDRQNGLYTVCVRGVENGITRQENIINASISRVLSASTEWNEVLACAHNPEIKIILSNTTEVGIQLVQEDFRASPPVSFPGKLLAFLWERYCAFKGSSTSGMVIVPTELITDNGFKLEAIVTELAHFHNLDHGFIEWLEHHNFFCNSLVDRIVPGKPNKSELIKLENSLGYRDELLTMSEVFRLWAIEGDEYIRSVLSFAAADEGVVITSDINRFKELKLRLLNGTHTFNCGTAFLSGFNITRDAVLHPVYGAFTRSLMHGEIAPAIPFDILNSEKKEFANQVFERFCNPFIEHQWQSITVQYTSKMKMRNIPLLQHHYEQSDTVPIHMATAMAAYLLYMKVTRTEKNRFFAMRNDVEYEIRDDSAEYFREQWATKHSDALAKSVLSNVEIWGADLTLYPGFLKAVQLQLNKFQSKGVLATIAELENQIIIA